MVRFNEAIDQVVVINPPGRRKPWRSRKFFFGMLSHDLRNSFHAATMLSGILVGAEGLGSEERNLATRIKSSADAMGSMVRDLIDLAVVN
jgi:signal transduction histidine kinase